MVFGKTKQKLKELKKSPLERAALVRNIPRKSVRSVFGFIDELSANKGGARRKKGKRRRAFGKIKDKRLIEGGFF